MSGILTLTKSLNGSEWTLVILPRHLEQSPVLQPEGAQPSPPNTAGIQADGTFFHPQAQRRPVSEDNRYVSGPAVLVFEPGPVGGWL